MEFRHGSQFEFICGIRDFKHVISLKEISPVSEIILFSVQNNLRHLVFSEIATAALQPRNDAVLYVQQSSRGGRRPTW
jgi:hypothetical protein